MNERIKSLIERAEYQAGKHSGSDWEVYVEPSREQIFEKFAELILIEVTDILSTYRGKMVFEDGAEYNYEHPIIAIRKHFGVKE